MASSLQPARTVSTHRGGRRERRRREIRDRLYRAALALFAERGFGATTVEDITESADVGKGTFFNYFPSKEHVLATFGSERIAFIETALQEAKKGPVLPVLRKMTADLATHCAESPALLRAIYAAHSTCEPVRAELRKRLLISRSLMTEIFSLARSRGEVRRDIPAADLARVMQLVLFGVALAWAINPEGSARDATMEVWDLFSSSFSADQKRGRAIRSASDTNPKSSRRKR